MGRRPNALVGEYFTRGSKCSDSSNRYSHTCKRCGENFPKGRVDTLMSHLMRRCSSTSQVERNAIYHAIQQQNPMPPAHGNVSFPSPGQIDPSRITEPQAELPMPALSQNPQQSALDTLAEVSRQHLDITSQDGPAQQGQTERNQHVESQDAEAQFYAQLRDAVKAAQAVTTAESKSQSAEQVRELDANPGTHSPTPHAEPAPASNEQLKQTMPGQENLDPALKEDNERPREGKSSPQQPDIDNISDVYRNHVPREEQPAAPTEAPVTIHDHHEPMSWIPTNGPVETHPSSHNLSSVMATAKKPMSFLPNDGVAVAHTFTENLTDVMAAAKHPIPGFGPLRNNTKIRSKFSDNRRKEVQEIRKRGACIRCRMLKKPCSEGTPCNTCKTVGSARLWKGSCLRTRLADEFILWSSGLFSSRSKAMLADATLGLEKASEETSVEVRLLPHSDLYITLAATKHNQNNLAKQRAAMNAYGGADPDLVLQAHFDAHKASLPVYLLVEEVGVLSKIEDYINQVVDICINTEVSPLLKATLQQAQTMVKEEEATSKRSTADLPPRSLAPMQNEDSSYHSTRACYTFQNQLLRNVVELWVETTILTRQKVDDDTGFHIKIPAEDPQPPLPIHNLTVLRTQLQSALESRCAQLSKSIISELERRLLQRQQVSRFATFISSVILLNCVERMTGDFHAVDTETPANWPLESPPSDYWPQGSHFADLLIMLLRMRGLPPKTMPDGQGKLVVVRPSVLTSASATKQAEHEAAELAAAWLECLELDFGDLIRLRDGNVPEKGETWDLRFIVRAILPVGG